jgi:hypothetical protein
MPVVKTLSVGQQVTIHINIESREYQDKWFSNINVWRVDKLDGNSVPTNTASSTNSTKATKSNASSKDDDSDLPF